MTPSPPVWRVPGWERIPGLVHAFFGRRGGYSEGEWASLNVPTRSGDDPLAVDRNRERIRAVLGGLDLVTMQQVHGAASVRVDDARARIGEADAIVTQVAGIGLGILTADCVPALLVAPSARVAVAVHAGWRGTVAGVLPAAVAAVGREYRVAPADLRVALGPAIGGCCYEVGTEVAARIERTWGALSKAAWQSTGERGRLDLRHANAEILARLGVPPEQILRVGPCTACQVSEFFSHRRENGRTGRQLSVVGWAQNEVVKG